MRIYIIRWAVNSQFSVIKIDKNLSFLDNYLRKQYGMKIDKTPSRKMIFDKVKG